MQPKGSLFCGKKLRLTIVMACNKFIMSPYSQAPQEGKSREHILADGNMNLARKRTQVRSMLSQSSPKMLLKNPKVQS